MRPTPGWSLRTLALMGVVGAVRTDSGWLYVFCVLAIGIGTAFGWMEDSE